MAYYWTGKIIIFFFNFHIYLKLIFILYFCPGTPYGKYNVIDTDYDTYTLIYSCESILGVAHIEFAWILAREMHINQTLTDKLLNELQGYGVDVSKFVKTDQEGCPA